MSLNKNLVIIVIVSGVLGWILCATFSKPDRVIDTTEVDKREKIISNLRGQLKILSEENVKTKTVTVVVEKPDGTKVTTKTKNLEKFINKYTASEKKEYMEEDIKTKEKTRKETIYSTNSVGVFTHHTIAGFGVEPVVFLKSSTSCFIVTCFIMGTYGIINKQVGVNVGVALQF